MLKTFLCVALAVTTATCAFQAYLLHEVSAKERAAVHVYCGSYDMTVVGHDAESYTDAAYAALHVVHTQDCSLVRN